MTSDEALKLLDEELRKFKEQIEENRQMATLRVTGPNFVAAIIFEKQHGEWKILDIAPILRKIIGRSLTPQGVRTMLEKHGFKYEWI